MKTSISLPAGSVRTPRVLGLLAFCFLLPLPLSAQLSLEKLWEVGQIDGPPETIWGRVADATTFRGVTYVVDILAPTVRMFEAGTGAYIGDFGRVGAGPGEYERPIATMVVDDELWISDIIQDRTVVLDERGRHLRTERWREGFTRLNTFWPLVGGWFVGLTSMDREVAEGLNHVLVWRDEAGVDTVQTLDAVAFQRRYVLAEGHDTGLSPAFQGAYGPAGGVWPLGDTAFVVIDGESSTAEFYRVEEDGPVPTRSMQLGRHGSARPDSVRAVQWWLDYVGLPDGHETLRRVVPPRILPAWLRVLGDETGRLWIERGDRNALTGDSTIRWARWSPGQEELEWLEVPSTIKALSFREGVMVGLIRGDFGVERIVAYRIVEN